SFTVKDAFLNPTPLQQIIYLEKHAKDVFPQNENSRQVGQSISFNEESQDLSIAQQQILFLEKSQNVGALHNLPAAIKITGDLDLNRLGSALSILIHKYEALRTYFKSENKKIVRKVSNTHTPASLEIEKIKGTLEEVSALLAESAKENFDLSKWPLMKVKFFETHCGQKILFFNFHHIIWDGWCFDLFFEELNKYYVTQDFDHTLEDQKNLSSYSNYVLKQQRYLKSDKGTNDKKYWKTILSHPSNKLQLPYLPTKNNNADVSSSFSLNFNRKNYHSIINQYAQKYSTTVYCVLLACFKITLAKYSQNNDITVGVPVQNRNTPELKYTLGYFVNTLPIRSHIDLDLSFNENLKLIQTQCLDAYEHQELPFFEIQRLVDEDSRNHFLSGLFSFQDVSDRQGVFNNLPYSQINLNNASSHTNLDLWIKFSKNNIEGAFQFKNKVFSESFIHEFSDLYLHIIESCLSNPDKAIRSLSVSPKQREKLRQWGNGPNILQNKTVLEMFTSELNKNPNKIAVSCKSHSMSYSELNDVSDKIAFNLKLTINSPDTKVGVCIERSSYLSSVILAIFKCGYIYVPLDHTFPSERLNYILSDSKLDILITEKSLHLSPKTKNTQTVYLNDLLNIKKDESSNYKTLRKTDLNENSIAYILYTSGTTGTPKGVLISHKSLQNFASSMQDCKIINEYDKILAHTTICFDISILEILIPILSGASLHIADKTDVMEPNLLNTLIKKYSINMIQATPSTWKLLMSQQWKPENSNLKILTGGERVSQEVIDYLHDFSKNIYNMYGPTETTIWSSFQKISPNSHISAGKPIHNTQFIILGKNNEVLPPYALGELFIGGLGLSNGYHNKPDLSALKFKIVTTDVMSGVFYSTGDLAQWNESGEIEILGRNDSQIKINGYRLELFEIESCLRKLNLFTDTHIFIINKEDSPKIAAAVCLKSGKLSEEQDIKKYLSQYLPYYMIPQHFLFLDEIPKTASQKIDENALNFLLKNELESKYISVKENTLNEKIRKIWKSYLNIENINDSDNFFELGGHSLIALEMNTQLEEELNLKIPLKLLIEASDFSEFSKKVSDLKINPSTENESLVIIKNGLTKKNSLFCFHAVGGSVLNYAVLSSSLPTEQYLVGFQSRALDGITPVKSSIEDMARDYVSELLNFQPEGPFTLCGGSMGGMIAFEVAQQLIAKGHQIKKLILFDTFGPEINLLDFDTPLDKLKSIVRPLFKNKVDNPYSHLLVNQITHQNYNALLKYRPKEYKGDIHLLRGKRTLFGIYKDKYMGWRSTVKGDILIDYIHAPHDYFIEHADFKAAFEKIIKND
ncbi:MAG: non-ribosomal peptide synthetase, partial [Pseudobdellovibrio sp.]